MLNQKKIQMNRLFNQEEKGFTLVLSILIVSLVLSIGLSLLNISLKEKQLSASGRDSQIAFHAADSAMECALYWDLKGGGVFDTAGSFPNISCNGTTVTQSLQSGQTESGGNIYRVFEVTYTPTSGCAEVSVTKVGGLTTIDARGYNTCNVNYTRRVERGLEATY